MADKFDIDLNQGLKEQGLTFKDMSKDGTVIATNERGEEFDINVPEFLKAHGISDPKQVGSITYNTPQQALNSAPETLTTGDRAKLSVGNTKGSLSYLKKKFEDVSLDEEKGLVVKEKGVWKRVDPSGVDQYFKDPWELSRDLADLTDIGINAAATIYGATKGASAAAPFGPWAAVAGAIGGAGFSGATAGAFRTSLGRLVGTYEADAKEQMFDIGIEGLYSMGGEGIGLGAKPLLGGLIKAVRGVTKVASEGTKEVLIQGYAKTTSAGVPATRALFDSPGEVGATLKNITKGQPTATAAEVEGMKRSIEAGQELLEESTRALPKKYGQLAEEKIFSNPKSANLTFDLTQTAATASKAAQEAGFGRVVPITSGGKAVVDPITLTATSTPKKITGYKFQAFSPDELKQIWNVGDDAGQILTSEEHKLFDQVVKSFTEFSEFGVVKGRAGGKLLMEANATVNRFADSILTRDASPVLKKRVSSFVNTIRDGFSGQFEKAGLDKEYVQVQQLYSKYAEPVKDARRILNSGNTEQFVNKLVTDVTKNLTAKGDAEAMVSLLGKRGEELYKKVVLNHAASKFAPLAPKIGLTQLAASSGAGIAGVSVVANPITSIAAASQFSPRAVQAQVRGMAAIGRGTKAMAEPVVKYAMKALDTVKSLPPKQMREFLQHPKMVADLFETPGIAAKQEQAGAKQLLQEAGVVPPETLEFEPTVVTPSKDFPGNRQQ